MSVSEFERAVLILQGVKFDGNFRGDKTTLSEGGSRSLMTAIVGAVREDFRRLPVGAKELLGASLDREARMEEAIRQVLREHVGDCECISILKAAIGK